MPTRAEEVIDVLLDRALRGEAIDVEAAIAARVDLTDAERGEVRAFAASLGEGSSRERSTSAGNEAGSFRDYILIRELGRGGQGVVWLARDTRLNRSVALKVLERPDLVFDTGRSPSGPAARLRREAEVASKLDHPSICAVYETGVERGRPFIAMRYVPGETLAKKVATLRELPRTASSTGVKRELMARITLVERTARALHFAHEAGVVHRDIKPANVMVTPAGEPVILDFGLARDDTSDAPTLTASGEVFGSPAYMAPEQVEPRRGAVDRRTDVYALGVVLYELVALRRPFDSPTREGLYRAILGEPLRDPRAVEPAVPRDLAVVVATALERDRGRRYQTALDLAEDLRRVREREPIRARPAGPLLRLRRWTQRNPALAMSLAVVFVALAVALVESSRRLGREREGAARLGASNLFNSAALAVAEDPSLALRMAVEAADRAELSPPRLNSTLLAALADFREISRFQAHDVRCGAARSNADGSLLAVASGAEIAVWDPRGQRRLALLSRSRDATYLDFSADGAWLATGGWDGVELWRTSDWTHAASASFEGLNGLAFAPRGSLLVAYGSGFCEVFDVANGTLSPVDYGSEFVATTFAAAWSPDGNQLLITLDAVSVIVDVARRTRVEVASAIQSNTVPSFAIAGDCAAVGCAGGASLVDVRDGSERRRLASDDGKPAVCAAFAPGGRCVVVGQDDGLVKVFDTATGALLSRVTELQSPLAEASFDSSGERVLLRSFSNGVTIVAAVASGARIAEFPRTPACIAAFWDERQGEVAVVTIDERGAVRRWGLATASERATVGGLGHPGNAVAFDASGQRIAAYGPDETRIYDVATLARVDTVPARARWVEFDRTSNRLVTASNAKDENEGVVLWDGEPLRRVRRVLLHETDASTASFSPDGRRLVVACCDERGHVVDLATDEIVLELVGHSGDLRSAFFSEDGRYVVTSSEHYSPELGIDDRTVRVWDAGTGRELAVLAFAPLGERPVIARFSSDGTRVVAGTWSGKIALWDWRRDELQWLLGNPRAANDARFSPDGRFVLSGSEDRSLRLWFVDTRGLAAHFTGHTSTVFAHAFSPDGRTIASQSTDGTLRLWPLDPLAEARATLARLGPPTHYERERIDDALAGR